MDDFLKNSLKRPVQIGSVVFIYNGYDEVIKTYPTIVLGKAFFSMSNDAFFNIYGFNFVPEGKYWDLSKRAAGKM